jgi:hypothetical protein
MSDDEKFEHPNLGVQSMGTDASPWHMVAVMVAGFILLAVAIARSLGWQP